MEYNFTAIEKKWQTHWAKNKTFKTENYSTKPKYYVLDMFPYPSGAGLHVGHPLGYIASDIYARYKRLKGFNVLHPMGYDSFGLPAEQYAIQTGQHPEITTQTNIARYREQLDKIGFSFDWDREVRTSNPDYYKWTQWIFIQIFESWYNNKTNKAASIKTLIAEFEKEGNINIEAACEETAIFSAEEWNNFSEKEKSDILLNYRLAYLSDTMVNWCPQLGTVLANEEVKEGVSERGGYPVERKLMQQWSMRISAYADRLLKDLERLDWTESIKEAQRNWIGKSVGSSLKFNVQGSTLEEVIEVFTTRPDTIFGVSFVTLAPEHELVKTICSNEQKAAVEEYIEASKNRSERERMADVKNISGVFTGAYVIHPFTGKNIPIWIGDYVLAGYGTGAVMAVPAHDARDYAFAKHFDLPILEVIAPPQKEGKVSPAGGDLEGAYDAKEGTLINSDFLNDLEVTAAIKKAISTIEEKGIGKGKTNFRLRDAIFGRQRYWGEPIPVYYQDGIPKVLDENELPLILPEVDKYLPTETGEPPLARASSFKKDGKYDFEHSTMPGWAGSSWYYLRYMNPDNETAFASSESIDYWSRDGFGIDLYIGGAEHATGHLLYVRFWTKFLNDIGKIPFHEPAKKLINQGMIQGVSEKIYKVVDTGHSEENNSSTLLNIIPIFQPNTKTFDSSTSNGAVHIFISSEIAEHYKGRLIQLNVDISKVKNGILDIIHYTKDKFKSESNKRFVFVSKNGNLLIQESFNNLETIGTEEIQFKTFQEVEKMSKSKWNVVSPDDIVEQHGADCLRLYEMFLGPLELAKPWSTNGITGVSNFIRKLWRLVHSPDWNNSPLLGRGAGGEAISDDKATKEELKTLHKTIKKIVHDIENFSFNTSVSSFMICVNELTELKCHKREIIEPLAILISPYAPHIAEEIWSKLGHSESITYASFPVCNEEYLVENTFKYPVSFNGKTRFFQEYDRSLSKQDIEKEVMSLEQTAKYLEGKSPKKIIVVPNRIINIVL